ncbi:MAG: TRAP transporter substrate-binding protein [Azospirillaceae bacterium]
MRTLNALGAAGALALAAATAMPAQAETLSLAHWVPPQHVLTSSTIEPLQAALAEATDDLEIQVYPGGELGAGPLEQYIRAVQGVADITWGLQGYTSSQFPLTMISELPGVLPEGMGGYDLIWNAYADHLTGEFPGTVPLALWLSEPNVIIMRDREVRSPSDLEGLRIRVSGSAAAAVVEALGATPVQMPAGEIYNALQTGLIDGLLTGASAIRDFRLDEVATSFTLGAPLGHISFYLVMNAERYDGLSEEHRAAIDTIAGRALSQSAEEGWNERAGQVIADLRADPDKTVIDLTEAEIAAFAELTLPVTDRIIDELGAQDVLDAMQGE